MGILWSKLRGKETSQERLERITEEIRSLEDHKFSAIKQQKNIIFLLFVISGLIYIFALGVFYFYYLPSSPDWVKRCLYSLPLVVFPLLVYLLKQFLQWYYLQVIDKKEDKLKDLRREKKRILDKVMETETYKVAKELLEKYEPSVLKESRPNSCPSSPANSGYSNVQQQQQQRVRYRGSMPPPMLLNSSFIRTPERPRLMADNSMNASQTSIQPISPQFGRVSMIRPALTQYPALPAPRLSRPILDQNRSIVDKLVDYVVGDGPGNRYALICNNCSGHNGMALKEEFEFISFRCCYCMSFNPSRKQRPFAPNISQSDTSRDKNLAPLIDEPESDNDSRPDENKQTAKIAEIKEQDEVSDAEISTESTPAISISHFENDGDKPSGVGKTDEENFREKEEKSQDEVSRVAQTTSLPDSSESQNNSELPSNSPTDALNDIDFIDDENEDGEKRVLL